MKSSPSEAKMTADDKKWQAESDMRSLLEAAEIRKDPARLKAALECARTKAAELSAIAKK